MVRLAGPPDLGERVRGYVYEPGTKLAYEWAADAAGSARPGSSATGNTIARRDRGRRIACLAKASNDGGYAIAGAANRVIRR